MLLSIGKAILICVTVSSTFRAISAMFCLSSSRIDPAEFLTDAIKRTLFLYPALLWGFVYFLILS